jgi:hypothetical protein
VSFRNFHERIAAVTAQRVEGHEYDPFGGAVVDDVLVAALGQVVLILDRRDRHDLAGPLDLVDADLGEADVADVPAVAVLLDRSEAFLERRLGSIRCK